jgi:hypothetical protein
MLLPINLSMFELLAVSFEYPARVRNQQNIVPELMPF